MMLPGRKYQKYKGWLPCTLPLNWICKIKSQRSFQGSDVKLTKDPVGFTDLFTWFVLFSPTFPSAKTSGMCWLSFPFEIVTLQPRFQMGGLNWDQLTLWAGHLRAQSHLWNIDYPGEYEFSISLCNVVSYYPAGQLDMASDGYLKISFKTFPSFNIL